MLRVLFDFGRVQFLILMFVTGLFAAPLQAANPDVRLWEGLDAEDPVAMKAALQAGAFTDALDPRPSPAFPEGEKITPLLAAIYRDQNELVHLLLENGASVHHRSGRGATPLHFAVEKGNLPMTKALLEAGADPDLVVEVGSRFLPMTIVDVAISSGSSEVLDFFLQRGHSLPADPDGRWNALMLAVHSDSPTVFEYLRERNIGLISLDAEQRETLIEKARANHGGVLFDYLMEQGIAESLPIQEQFLRALSRGRVELAAKLLKQGATWDENAWGAAKDGLLSHAKLTFDFIASEAPAELIAKAVPMALDAATQTKDAALVKRIYTLPEIPGLDGRELGSALIWAVETNNGPLIEWLLSLPGIDVNHPGYARNTALQLSLERKRPKLAARLLALGAKPHESPVYPEDWLLRLACEGGYEELTGSLLEVGARWEINLRDKDTVLGCTVRHDRQKMLRLLLAEMNERELQTVGAKLMRLAVEHERKGIISVLREAGVSE